MTLRRRTGLVAMSVIGLLFTLLIWWVFGSEFMAVDGCLDAGGRWGDGGSCEFAEPRA